MTPTSDGAGEPARPRRPPAGWLAAVRAAGRDPERWIALFERAHAGTASGLLGVTLVEVDDEGLLLRMPITDRARQPLGMLHGGISLLLAETAASFHACWGVDLERVVPVGLEVSGSHLRPARDGTVSARASVLRRGRTVIVHRVVVRHEPTRRALCEARVTNLYRPIEPR